MHYAEEKIQEAKARTSSPNAKQPKGPSQEQLDLIEKLQAEAAEASKEKNDLLERLQVLEKKMNISATGGSGDTAAAVLNAEAAVLCNRTIIYSTEDIPELKTLPDKKYKLRLVLIATNLMHWSQAGRVPITFRQLLSGSGTEDEATTAMLTVKEVAGEKIWDRLYDDKDVSLNHFIPFQLGCILAESLAKAQTKMNEYAKLIDYTDEAKKRFAEIHAKDTVLRKERKGPYSN